MDFSQCESVGWIFGQDPRALLLVAGPNARSDPCIWPGSRRRVDHDGDGALSLVLEGDGFLKHMVRIIVGTLVEVGCGLRTASSIPSLLESGDRMRAGPTAPAQGLCLEHSTGIFYPLGVRM